MTEWLFAPSFWTILLLVVLGGIVAAIGNRRLDKKLQNVGLVIAGLGLILAILDTAVETPIERTTLLTRGFVQAVVDKDESKLKSIMDPNCNLSLAGRSVYINGIQISIAAVDAANQYSLTGAKVTGLTPTASANTVSMAFVVWSQQTPQPMRTEWNFDYEKIGEQWLLARITLVKVGDMPLDNIGRYLPHIPIPSMLGGNKDK